LGLPIPARWPIPQADARPLPAIDLKRARQLALAAMGGKPRGVTRRPTSRPQSARRVRNTTRSRRSSRGSSTVTPSRRIVLARTERLNREIIPAWGGRRLSSIARADVHALLDSITDRGSPIMANRTLAPLRRMSAWAVERDLIPVSPCEKVTAPAAETSRDGPCGARQAPDLDRRPAKRDRRGEMERDRPRRKTINAPERARKERSRAPRRAFGFGRGYPSLGTRHHRLGARSHAERAQSIDPIRAGQEAHRRPAQEDTPAWVFHDLRRTFASGCAKLGTAIHVVEKCLNHSIRGIVSVYQKHDFANEQRAARAACGGGGAGPSSISKTCASRSALNAHPWAARRVQMARKTG
jgi:hypothetical protein